MNGQINYDTFTESVEYCAINYYVLLWVTLLIDNISTRDTSP